MEQTPQAGRNLPAPLTRWLLDRFVWMAAVLCLVIYALTYIEGAFGKPVRSDGAGYFAYLPSLLIYHDPSFERYVDAVYEGVAPGWAGIERYRVTGRYVIMYNLGCAALAAPWYLLGHLAANAVGFPLDQARAEFPYKFVYATDGQSLFYQHAAALAGLGYGLLGLALLRRQLLRRYPPGPVLCALTALLLGTNLLNYLSGESFSAHAFLFFLYAAWINVVPDWYAKPGSWRRSILLGLVAGLIPAVRTPAALIWLIFPLYGITSTQAVPGRIALWWRHGLHLAAAGLTAALAFAPQMLMWHYGTGHWIVNTYALLNPQLDLTHWSSPHFLQVLFGIRHSLFFFSPVLLFAVAGIASFRRDAPELWWPALLILAMVTWLIASWHDWSFGGSYGHRGFLEFLTLLAFPLASFYRQASGWRRGWRVAVGVATVLCIGWGLFFMMLYYTREMSIYGLDRQALFDIFWWRLKAL